MPLKDAYDGDGRPPEPETERLRACRAAFARRVAAHAHLPAGSAIEAALATIPREWFVQPPPWEMRGEMGLSLSASDDPAVLYRDVTVPLGCGWGLNNGQPSLHAMCLHALAIGEGESVVHVGAGTGYYTTVLAMLVGETGRVDAYEIEPEAARRAKANLKELTQVEVHCRSGAEGPLPQCDALYVNAAAAEPLPVWLDAPRPGGRLLFPLAPEDGAGAMLLATRQAEGPWAARFLGGVQFVACAGAQNAQAGRALRAAFERGGSEKVRHLHRNSAPDERCWCAGRGWWLGTE